MLAGFSQGGAIALHTATRYPEKLAGVIALSCYLPMAREFATDRSAANHATPIYMAHGTQDPVVPFALGDESRRILEGTGYRVEWRTLSDAAFAVRGGSRGHQLLPAESADGISRVTQPRLRFARFTTFISESTFASSAPSTT